MSFLDKVKETAGVAAKAAAGAANTAVRQTKTLASEGRVKLAISSEEDKLKKAYTELGRLFYRDYAAQAEADMEEYLPWCARAEEARRELQRLTEELEALKTERKESGAPAQEAPKAPEPPREDTSVFADMEEPEAAPAASETPTEPALQPDTSTEPEAPAEPEEPKVNTLYVDVSGLED